MIPDEKGLRRPEFNEEASHPVAFGAAGTWFLPKPHTRTRFVFGNDRRVSSTIVVTDDPEFNSLSKSIEENDTYSDIGNMAAYLLLRNYDLTEDQLSEILEYDPKDESSDRWAIQVMSVIYGRTGPKA